MSAARMQQALDSAATDPGDVLLLLLLGDGAHEDEPEQGQATAVMFLSHLASSARMPAADVSERLSFLRASGLLAHAAVDRGMVTATFPRRS